MDSDVNVHQEIAKLEEDLFSIAPEKLRDTLIRKHNKFLENYKEELKNIKEKKGREVVLKKMIEILPDKTDLLEYWSKNLEESLNKVNNDTLAQEIREKIIEYRKEKQNAEMEFSARQDELEEIEKEMNKNSAENREEWLTRKVESHKKSLNFWKCYKTEDEKKVDEEKRKKEKDETVKEKKGVKVKVKKDNNE